MSSVFDGLVSYLGTIFVALLVLPDPSIVSQYEEITVHIILHIYIEANQIRVDVQHK